MYYTIAYRNRCPAKHCDKVIKVTFMDKVDRDNEFDGYLLHALCSLSGNVKELCN